ncbi:hypothetical protein TGVEG_244070 [Toxoplasma gondii VEG]|uniref:Uncharacterized protein n=1 Tax=Toxoplasma gondii (strain ATCC 50861 / VEG) TaxID=432359 RepID=B9QJM7_TOXGV|nr:hypothetical protein TGVEG_244070 [Toxoplasma gondii VEG]CEL73188.1 TPA: hypothetical protein BN1205_103780 [Toxoplasma gondii VEG]
MSPLGNEQRHTVAVPSDSLRGQLRSRLKRRKLDVVRPSRVDWPGGAARAAPGVVETAFLVGRMEASREILAHAFRICRAHERQQSMLQSTSTGDLDSGQRLRASDSSPTSAQDQCRKLGVLGSGKRAPCLFVDLSTNEFVTNRVVHRGDAPYRARFSDEHTRLAQLATGPALADSREHDRSYQRGGGVKKVRLCGNNLCLCL